MAGLGALSLASREAGTEWHSGPQSLCLMVIEGGVRRTVNFWACSLGKGQPIHQTPVMPPSFLHHLLSRNSHRIQTLTTGPHVKGPDGTGISQLWVSTATCWAGLLGGVHHL